MSLLKEGINWAFKFNLFDLILDSLQRKLDCWSLMGQERILNKQRTAQWMSTSVDIITASLSEQSSV